MSDVKANTPNVPNRDKFNEIAKAYHYAENAEAADKVLEENASVIALANKADRKLARKGLPLSVRLDDRTDEIPVVAGAKRVVIYGGGATALVLGGIKLYEKFWG